MPHSTIHQRAITRTRARRIGAWRGLMAALTITVLSAMAGPRPAQAGFVSLDTSSIAGSEVRLEINLFDGDDSFDNSHASAFGESVGDFGQILHDFIAGGVLRFQLNFSLHAGDLLVLSLLDPGTNFSLVDTDLDALDAPLPYEDAVLVCGPAVCTAATRSDPALNASFVPEPGTLALLGALPLALVRRLRARRRKA